MNKRAIPQRLITTRLASASLALGLLAAAASGCEGSGAKPGEPDPPATASPVTTTDAIAATGASAKADQPDQAGDAGEDVVPTPDTKPDTKLDPKPDPTAPKSNGLKSGPARPELVAAARAIQKDLECLRGLKFKTDPAVAFQSLDDFRAYVDTQVQKELGGEKGQQLVRMLHALDVVDPSIDVIKMLVEAAVGQAAAYYDPQTNTFYIVQEMPAIMLNSVMAHELQHALQDQHTELLDEYLDQGFGSTDKDLATRFIVEGEATLIGHSWLVTDTQTKILGAQAAPGVCHLPGARAGDPAQFWSMMRGVVAEAARQTRDDVLNPGLLTRLAANSMMSEGMADSMAQLKALPVYFFYTLLLPYNQGGLTVFEHFAAGGFDWTKVDALFDKPPETTEQVLHPEKLGTREPFVTPQLDTVAPIEGGPAAAAAWSSDPIDRLGELTLRILLIEEGLDEPTAVSAAAGWNGDAIRVWHAGDQLAFDWKIDWDSTSEMQEFIRHLGPVVATQRGKSVRGLEDLSADPSAAAFPFTWTDSQGRPRHGRISWAQRELHWTDGWSAPVKMSAKGG